MPSPIVSTAVKAAKIVHYKEWINRTQKKLINSYEKNPMSSKYRRIKKRLKKNPVKAGNRKIEYKMVEGRNAGYILNGKSRARDGGKILIFLHGGAYLFGPSMISWLFLDQLSNLSGVDSVLPDYPKAPEWKADYTLSFMERFYLKIMKQYGPEKIILVGSSAGGGLALSTVKKLQKLKIPLPSKLILISPWTDLSMDNPDIINNEYRDISLSRKQLLQAAKIYAGGKDLKSPEISPLLDDLSGLPPVMLLTGTEEMFLSDCRKLKEKLERQNVSVDYIEQPGLFHSWPVIPLLPESNTVRRKMADFIRN